MEKTFVSNNKNRPSFKKRLTCISFFVQAMNMGTLSLQFRVQANQLTTKRNYFVKILLRLKYSGDVPEQKSVGDTFDHLKQNTEATAQQRPLNKSRCPPSAADAEMTLNIKKSSKIQKWRRHSKYKLSFHPHSSFARNE